jgi:hypothetical protein
VLAVEVLSENRAMQTREELHILVDSLPEDALVPAERVLRNFQVWPPVAPDPADFRKRMEERRLEMRQKMKPGTIAGFGGGGSYDPTRGSGSSSFNYWDGDTFVGETRRHHQGHELTIIEHIRLDESAKQLFYKHEVAGPGGKHDEREITFETSAK